MSRGTPIDPTKGAALNATSLSQASGTTLSPITSSQSVVIGIVPVFDFYSGLPRKPSPFLQQTIATFEKYIGKTSLRLILGTGNLRDGREVAVKRLYEHNYKRVEQFMNEIDILTRLRHHNLVLLYGITSHRSHELLLVYEYIPNGTVVDHLHGNKAETEPLTWPVRMNIAIETASALFYLHKYRGVSLEMLPKLVRVFGSVIYSLSALSSVGVDIEAEQS